MEEGAWLRYRESSGTVYLCSSTRTWHLVPGFNHKLCGIAWRTFSYHDRSWFSGSPPARGTGTSQVSILPRFI